METGAELVSDCNIKIVSPEPSTKIATKQFTPIEFQLLPQYDCALCNVSHLYVQLPCPICLKVCIYIFLRFQNHWSCWLVYVEVRNTFSVVRGVVARVPFGIPKLSVGV